MKIIFVALIIVAVAAHADAKKKCSPVPTPAPESTCSGTNEVYSACGAYCQSTCGPPTPCARPPQDCNPGCVCVAGYVRKVHGGICILRNACPASDF